MNYSQGVSADSDVINRDSHDHTAVAVQDNYPEMEVTCMDLSPFYLAKARENMKYWCALLRQQGMWTAHAFTNP